MDRDDLYTFVTGLLDGFEMDETLFETFLDVSQAIREGARPWMQLRDEDATIVLSTSNTYTTPQSLPTNFRRWYARYSVALVDAQGNLSSNLLETPLAMKINNRMNNTKFYCNYGSRKIFFCGNIPQALTAYLFYIRKATLVSAAASNSWEFPSEYHKILGFDIAAFWKLGVDYDVINNPQGNANAAAANALMNVMADWDNELQLSSVQGASYGQDYGGVLATSSGGRLGPDIING